MRVSTLFLASLLIAGPAAAQGTDPAVPPLDGGVTLDGGVSPVPGTAGAPVPPDLAQPDLAQPDLAPQTDGTAIDGGASQGTMPANRMPTGPELLPGMLDSQIQKCWSMPVMKGDPGEGGIARIRVKLLPDGNLEGQPMMMDKPAGPKGLVFAESAARAIVKCAPYKLPPEQYEAWKDITLYFDTLDF